MVSERVQGSVQAEQGSVVPPCSKGPSALHQRVRV